MDICVIGLGYIGLPTAVVLAKHGHNVSGYDADPLVTRSLCNGMIHIKEEYLQEAFEDAVESGKLKIYDDIKASDVYIIAVPTPFKDNTEKKEADLSCVDRATELVASVLKEGDLVILESTSPPLTTKRMTERLISLTGLPREKFFTAYCPERVLPGHILYELENNDRIIGAEKKEAAEYAASVYEVMLKNGKIHITDDVTAEMTKLVENSYRDINIAFANELSVICDEAGVDVHELIALANKHPRVDILKPGIGVGGHCISVDPWFLVEKFENANLIRKGREINDQKPYWVVSKLEEAVDYDRSKTIGILGLSFKANVDDLRESPSQVVIKELLKKGYCVIGCEPNIKESESFGIKLYDIFECSNRADVLLMAQRHNEFVDNMSVIEKKLVQI